MKVEYQIITYDSVPTDLASEVREWSEFVDGKGYLVLLCDEENEARTWRVRDPNDFPMILCSGIGRSSLLDRLLGRTVQALEEHSDNLMIHGPYDPSRKSSHRSSLPKLEIDGRNIDSLAGFWDEISRVLIPGIDWGRNLDAFNDILRGGFGTPEEFELVWKHSENSRSRLSYSETIRQLEIRRMKCHPTAIEETERRLELAHEGRGFTVFDWLLEIARERPEVKLTLD